jgi:hypothetical protein
MPRYFFHILNGNSPPVNDDHGSVLQNFEAARVEARLTIGELEAYAAKWGNDASKISIQIAAEDGNILEILKVGPKRE